MRAVHCIQRDGPYCSVFRKDGETGNGKDLATVVYYRHVEEDDPCEWTLNLAGKSIQVVIYNRIVITLTGLSLIFTSSIGRTTTWAVVVSVPNVNRETPIQRVAGASVSEHAHAIKN